jgi:HSP20 family molecular chaperone IbpA
MANQLTPFEALRSGLSLRDAMDRLLAESFVWPRGFFTETFTGAVGQLPIDLYETTDTVFVHAVLPGVKTENVTIQFQNGRLIIDCNIPAPKLEDVTFYYRELPYGHMHREVPLPVPVKTEKAEAVVENGYLTLRLPKTEEMTAKKIPIKIVNK